MTESELEKLLESARSEGMQGHYALGRLIGMVDDASPESIEIEKCVKSSTFRAARIGITGPPGSGKSSLIACAVEILAEKGLKVGVLAVDPTSPYTGGAILGDRVRLKGPTGSRVFFRSLASRGSTGGVSRAIWPASRILDWWGADIILIETVGSGQLGTDVGDVADLVVAVITPEAGDGIQSMKAGIMELADCFVVNKSDRAGSDLMMKELKLVKEEAAQSGRKVSIYRASATKEEGISEAIDGISTHYRELFESGEIQVRRNKQVVSEIAVKIEDFLRDRTITSLGGLDEFERLLTEASQRAVSGELSVSETAETILRKISP